MQNSGSSSQTLGGMLRQERERRGITVDQVAAATKINTKQLYALEADQYLELPAKPFVRGFILSYSRFIGLDGQAILTQFGSFLDTKVQERPVRDEGHRGYAFERREGDQGRIFLWGILGSFIVLGGLAIFVFKPSLRQHRSSKVVVLKGAPLKSPTPLLAHTGQPISTSGPAPASGVLVPASPLPLPSPPLLPSVIHPSTVPSILPVPSPSPVRRPDPLNSGVDLFPSEVRFKVVFKALEDVWVRYRIDEKGSKQFPLRKGVVLVLKAQEKIIFQTSDATAVNFNLNSAGNKLLANFKQLQKIKGVSTYILPRELVETIEEPFPEEKAFPNYPPPASRAATQLPTAAQ